MKTIDTDKHSLLDMARLIDDWKQKYHVNNRHEIIFQNKALFSNVRFPSNFLHAGHVNSRGFENIPECVENPSEIWSYWKDPDKQRISIRNYLIFNEKICYCVTTEAREIVDAFAVVPSLVQKYRKGVPIFLERT